MASRDSQGLQIALIIFVMVTVVLAVTTFFFYRRSEELRKTALAKDESEKAARDNYNTENFKVQYLKHILGASRLADAEFKTVRDSVLSDADMKTIDDQYQQHMKTYGEGLAQDKLDYANLLPNMLLALRARNVANTNLSDQVNQLSNEKKQMQVDEQKRTQEALTGLQQAKDDLAAQLQQYEQDRAKLTKDKEDQLAAFKNNLAKFAADIDKVQKSDEALQGQMKKMKETIDDQKKKLDASQPRSFETADGLVTWVNQRSNTVWIDLGTADGLRRQTLFSVYGQEETGVAQSERKASIEVTRVLNEHLSEARIVEDNPSNPILPGDQLFSPSWKRGELVHFALAGLLDINGDRRSDRELVHNLITSSGGTIDAEVTETGEVTGDVNSSTRYLVLGEAPADRKALDAWTKMITAAEQLGVEKLQLDQFLSWAGYKREVRTIPLGSGASSNGFRTRPAPNKAGNAAGNAPANAAEGLPERQPPAPAAGGNSPF
jgi:hypothetical protein